MRISERNVKDKREKIHLFKFPYFGEPLLEPDSFHFL